MTLLSDEAGTDLPVFSSAATSARRQEIFLNWPDGNQGWFQSALASIHASDVVLTFQAAAVPEPATYGMLLGGQGMLGFAARRRRAR
nr:PEP-CTERM sorting domain-containing protein [Pseudoduganella plicata]